MAELETGKLLNQIKQDPQVMQQLLYPGKQLADFDASKLKVGILKSGFRSFDEKMLFKRGRGELIILGARPGIGKSALAFQLATNVAQYGKAHIFSLEMDHESIAARQMAAIMNKPLDYIQSDLITDRELALGRQELDKLNCIIDDRSSLNVNQICDAARMQNKKSRTDLIVVDYVQIVATDNSAYNRSIALGKVSMELKKLAKELRTPVIILSQLNRNIDYREGGRPQLSDLKESGSLEQDADVCILIHRPDDTPNTATMIIAKHRNGPVGDIPMQYASAQCKFIDNQEASID